MTWFIQKDLSATSSMEMAKQDSENAYAASQGVSSEPLSRSSTKLSESTKVAGLLARVQTPTKKWTAHQIIYVLVPNGILSMIIAAGANFAIGYGIYATPRPPPGPPPLSPPPFLFSLPQSLVGDALISTFVQVILTWYCSLVLINADLTHGRVAPLGFIREPTSRVARWFVLLDHYTPARGSAVCCCGPKGVARGLGFFFAQLGRACLVSVASFAVLIGPTIGVLVAVGTKYGADWVFLGRWDGAIFKTVYGGVLGLLVSPLIALMWLARAGWIVGDRQKVVEERQEATV